MTRVVSINELSPPPFSRGHYIKLLSGEMVLVKNILHIRNDWFGDGYRATGLAFCRDKGTVKEISFYEGSFRRHLNKAEVMQCKLMGVI